MRPSKDQIGIEIAQIWSKRSTCPLRSVGCLLVDKDFRTLSTGYNGTAKGLPHCDNVPCRAFNYIFNYYLDDRSKCEAIHAEANALLYCRSIDEIDTCYTTCSPCNYCIKLLLGTACSRIVFLEEHYHIQARDMWLGAGRDWFKYEIT